MRQAAADDAVGEVATPVLFGVTIIILVFLPLMTLEGMEGKMFAPLAYTIAIALAISLLLSRWSRELEGERPLSFLSPFQR